MLWSMGPANMLPMTIATLETPTSRPVISTRATLFRYSTIILGTEYHEMKWSECWSSALEERMADRDCLARKNCVPISRYRSFPRRRISSQRGTKEHQNHKCSIDSPSRLPDAKQKWYASRSSPSPISIQLECSVSAKRGGDNRWTPKLTSGKELSRTSFPSLPFLPIDCASIRSSVPPSSFFSLLLPNFSHQTSIPHSFAPSINPFYT